MKKLTTLGTLLFILISAAALNAQQTRIAVIPFTGGSDNDGDMIARLLGNELVRESRSKYAIAPRTSAINKVLEEHKFQRTGLTDADTIAELGKGANAQFVVTGHIRSLGGQKLVIVNITEVETLHQTAGAYYTYSDISETMDYMPNISKTLIGTTEKVRGNNAPTLAMLPFDIKAGNSTANTDAEVLAQILSCEIANTGKYSVVIRTSTISNVMKEHKIQQSAITSSENIQKIGEAINATYVLTGYVSSFGAAKLMGAEVLHVTDFIQQAGDSVRYKEMKDGLDIMADLSTKLTGVRSPNGTVTIADIIALCDARVGQERISDIKALLQTGNIEAKDDDGWTALIYASSVRHTEIAKALISVGADINAKDKYGWTALIYASRYGSTEIAKALIAAGADVNAKSNSGDTLLIAASHGGLTEIVKDLIAKGFDVNAKTDDGYTALIYASSEGHTEIAKALISVGADINAKDKYGWTALIYASSEGYTEIAKALIAAGASVNAKITGGYYKGKTAFSLADNNDIKKLLKGAGARE